jgi:predicted RNase H-like HicB family nuclease
MENTVKVLIIIEKGSTSYGAYSPDIPGCFAVGKTEEEVIRRMQEALQFHIQCLQEEHLPLPRVLTTSYRRQIWHKRWKSLLAFLRRCVAWLMFHDNTIKYMDISLSI